MIDWLINWFITDQSTDWLIDCGYVYIPRSLSSCVEVEKILKWLLCAAEHAVPPRRDLCYVLKEKPSLYSVCAYPTVIFVQLFCQSVWWIPTVQIYFLKSISNCNIRTYYKLSSGTFSTVLLYAYTYSTYVCACIHRVVLSVLWTCGQAVIGSLWCCTLNAVNYVSTYTDLYMRIPYRLVVRRICFISAYPLLGTYFFAVRAIGASA